jgi:hypothetical protein
VITMQHLSVRQLSLVALLSLALLGGCGRQQPAADAAKAAPEEKGAAAERKSAPDEKKGAASDEKAAAGDEKGAAGEEKGAAGEKEEGGSGEVKLTDEEVAKLGITTTAAAAVQYVPAKQGFGVVMSHDAIAQAVADVDTAQAGMRLSQAALARIARLDGTPGAQSAEARESATRQAAVDAAALRLAEAKSSAMLGQRPPWAGQNDSKMLTELAAGHAKLLRVTFPLGVLNGAAPNSLRTSRLDAATVGERWTARPVWEAPFDSTIPGRSFFAVLQHTDVGEGERVLIWAAGDNNSERAESGIVVPPAAVVVIDGKYWCFVEREPSVFSRSPVDISRPTADGYFVRDSIKPGDLIVTSAAGLLLARQTNPSTEAE